MKISIKYNLNFNIDFKSKPVIITLSVITILLLTLGIILYNISFKYDSQDPFFKKISERAEKLDDSYVYKKLYVTQLSFIFASSHYENGEHFQKLRLKILKDKNLTAKDISDGIIENPLPYPVFRHRSNKYVVKIIRALRWVKVSDRRIFAKHYTDINNKDYPMHNESQFTYVKLPYGTSLAYRITDPACKTRTSAGRFLCGDGYIDINGKREPNQLGVDLFDIGIYLRPGSNLLLGELYGEEQARTYCFKHNGQGCYRYAKNMDRSFLKKPETEYTTNYKFKGRIPQYVYLTPKRQLVFFNKNGFDSFVNRSTIKYQLSMIEANLRLPHPIEEMKASYEAYKFVRELQKESKLAEKEMNRVDSLPKRAYYTETGDPAPVDGVEPKYTLKQKYTKFMRDERNKRAIKRAQ